MGLFDQDHRCYRIIKELGHFKFWDIRDNPGPAPAGLSHAKRLVPHGAGLIVSGGGNMEASNVWKAFIAAVGTAATYLWGGWDAVFLALVTLACMDYVTGWAAAWVHGRLSSDIGRRGIAKKIGMFIVVAVCNILDQLGDLGEPILRTVAIWWYLSNEALSIVENLGEVGVPIPGRLRQALAVLRDKQDGEVGR